jgi:hypothetical protein
MAGNPSYMLPSAGFFDNWLILFEQVLSLSRSLFAVFARGLFLSVPLSLMSLRLFLCLCECFALFLKRSCKQSGKVSAFALWSSNSLRLEVCSVCVCVSVRFMLYISFLFMCMSILYTHTQHTHKQLTHRCECVIFRFSSCIHSHTRIYTLFLSLHVSLHVMHTRARIHTQTHTDTHTHTHTRP